MIARRDRQWVAYLVSSSPAAAKSYPLIQAKLRAYEVKPFLAFFLACWVLYALHPPPFRLNDTGSSLGPDWDCARGPYTTACVKRIGPSK